MIDKGKKTIVPKFNGGAPRTLKVHSHYARSSENLTIFFKIQRFDWLNHSVWLNFHHQNDRNSMAYTKNFYVVEGRFMVNNW